MQSEILILSFGLLSCGSCLQAQEASLAGSAADAVTHKPLSGVHLRLVLELPDAPIAVYGAMSDATGRLSITGIPPGTYAMMPERAGFVYMAAPTLTLKAGERRADFTLEMTPQTVIAGRVVDEYGDPVPNVGVVAVSAARSNGKARFETPFNAAAGRTNDRGEFRIRGAPGKYRLRAAPPTPQFNGVPASRMDDDANAVYGITWYPGTASEDGAAVLDAAAGRELAGSDIRLVRQHTLTISGVITGIPDPSAPTFIFVDSGNLRLGSTNVARDGRFVLTGCQPGVYRLTAMNSSQKTPLLSRPIEVRLDNTDVTNVELTLLAGEELTGTLEMRDGREQSTVLLDSAGANFFDPQHSGGEVDKEGAFRIRDLFPGAYRVRVEPLPGNSYVKEIRLNDTVVNGTVDLSEGVRGASLKVTVSPDGGQISGTVAASDGTRLANTAAMVFLVADPNQIRNRKSFPVGADGGYTIHGISPGKYRLFAVPASQFELDGFESGAQEIEVAEGARITQDLKLTTKEDANARQ